MQLSVIIINYNVKYFLEQCLHSVQKAMHFIDGEIIVIDNNSTDDSFSFFQNKFNEVHFIWNQTNVGFAKANNQALTIAHGEYILFLNPDTLIPEDCFEKCITFIQSKGNNCAIGIKMLDGSGKFLKESKRAFPDPVTSLYKLSGFARLFPHSQTFSRYHLGHLDENKNHEIDVLAGAFIMMPKNILKQINGFDEDFFMYGEDVDLSFRIQKAGYKNYYFSESCVIHFKGESTKKGSLNYVKMFYKAMSIFVKKHYGGSKAGLFNILIQFAIMMRALFAAFVRFLKWIGLPVIDACIILMSFYLVKLFWSAYIKQEINYSPNMLIIAFPAFTFLFLVASWISGLYDNGYKQSRLNKSTLISMLVILSAYSLLPERLRFSRGILLFGSITAFLFMTIVRQLLIKWKIIVAAAEGDENKRIVIAGSLEEFKEVRHFLEMPVKKESVLGRIGTSEIEEENTIGRFENLHELMRSYPMDEIIFCEGVLSFKKIIDSLCAVPQGISIKFFAKGSYTIIGSDDRNTAGAIISKEENYRLDDAVYRRSKYFFDLLLCLFFIITFPIHFILKKRPVTFFKNVFCVFFQKKTWVGYAAFENYLPEIKPGIITTTGLPHSLNHFPRETLCATDKIYAKNYHVFFDLKLIRKHYRLLS
ncbi:MAG: glycosyltransferase [Ginsengibacter sp.]